MNIYALIDSDNFYVSCERIFRPDLLNKPTLVLSNNDGCVISRSNEVKALGIKMGEPYFKILDTIKEKDITVFSSNYVLYADISNRIVEILKMFSPDIEVYSIDESFLKLNIQKEKCFEYAKLIRDTILKNTGVPTTVGVANTKTLTKIASKVAKKNPQYEGTLCLLDSDEHDKYLEMIDVEDIWGVGKQYSKWLHSIEIHNAKEFKYSDSKVIQKRMTVNGYKTLMELNNIECIPLEKGIPAKKSIVNSRSFGELTDSLCDIKKALARNVTRASEKLRTDSCLTNCITIFLTTSPFRKPYYSNATTIYLPYPISDSSTLIKYAFEGLEKIFKRGYMYKKTGVYFTNITPLDSVQLNIYSNQFFSHNRNSSIVMDSVDCINRKWGRDMVKVGSMGIDNRLEIRKNMISPRYTTSWEELLMVTL